jgi:hypothetical protein
MLFKRVNGTPDEGNSDNPILSRDCSRDNVCKYVRSPHFAHIRFKQFCFVNAQIRVAKLSRNPFCSVVVGAALGPPSSRLQGSRLPVVCYSTSDTHLNSRRISLNSSLRKLRTFFQDFELILLASLFGEARLD